MTAKDRSIKGKSAKESKPPASRTGGRRHVRLEPESIRFEPLVAALVMVAAIIILYPGHTFQDKIFFSSDKPPKTTIICTSNFKSLDYTIDFNC